MSRISFGRWTRLGVVLTVLTMAGSLAWAATKTPVTRKTKTSAPVASAAIALTDSEVLARVITQKIPQYTQEMATTGANSLLKYNAGYAQGLLDRFKPAVNQTTAWNRELNTLDAKTLRWVVEQCFLKSIQGQPTAFNPNAGGLNSITTVVQDMGTLHDTHPHGVPLYWDWANNPRIGMGNNPGSWTQLVGWGQVYEVLSGSPATNTRVQLKNLETFVLSKKTNKWVKVQGTISGQAASPMTGASYVEDFKDNVSKPANLRKEPDGGISVKLEDGYNFHFFPASRANITPSDVAGVFTTVRARLVVDSPSQPDDRAKARYLVSMGADYWKANGQWDNFATNGDVAMGRMKYVTPQWQSFNMTTLSGSALQKTPPPLNDEK